MLYLYVSKFKRANSEQLNISFYYVKDLIIETRNKRCETLRYRNPINSISLLDDRLVSEFAAESETEARHRRGNAETEPDEYTRFDSNSNQNNP